MPSGSTICTGSPGSGSRTDTSYPAEPQRIDPVEAPRSLGARLPRRLLQTRLQSNALPMRGDGRGRNLGGRRWDFVWSGRRRPPQPDFDWSPESPAAGGPVAFTDESQGEPPSGSGTSGTGTHRPRGIRSHTYESPGIYPVTLEVFNAVGTSTADPRTTVSLEGVELIEYELPDGAYPADGADPTWDISDGSTAENERGALGRRSIPRHEVTLTRRVPDRSDRSDVATVGVHHGPGARLWRL